MSVKQVVMAAAGALGGAKAYIEDVFSTYLYTGNGSTQTITNGIDLAGEGGLVWLKARSNAYNNNLFDTERGIGYRLNSNTTNAQVLEPFGTVSSTGFAFTTGLTGYNDSGTTYASWTFRKAPKFFDIVTFTHSSAANSVISHSLDSTPGCVIVKRTDGADSWWTYHRGLSAGGYLTLNTTNAQNTASQFFQSVTSTSVTIGKDYLVSGQYVAYLFAHDAGGFGDAGDQSVIKCGSFTGNGGTQTIELGWEPQWILTKNASNPSGFWYITDNMRGWANGGTDARLRPESSDIERFNSLGHPTSTGFTVEANSDVNGSGDTIIYIAIRRGPMKTPTDGTSVFEPTLWTGTGSNRNITGSFVPDMFFTKTRDNDNNNAVVRRLTDNKYLSFNNLSNESTDTTVYQTNTFNLTQTGVGLGNGSVLTNYSGLSYVGYFLKRAPGFYDAVCYSGDSSTRNISHNLGVVPELMIVSGRTSPQTYGKIVYHKDLGNTKWLQTSGTQTPFTSSSVWNDTTPTSSVFTLGNSNIVNGSGYSYVADLFASVPGVSKVGSYTGNGTSQTIDCGFSNGARFVMIKRTDDVSNWNVWDTARGIVSGTEPFLRLNTTSAEFTTNDTLDPSSSGFIVNQDGTSVNISGATYIYLAIA